MTPAPDFLAGGGACGALIGARDWTGTLGPLATWPAELRLATSILLRSPVPMVMLWGEDGIMIYNDAYAAFAGGRHPALLGAAVRAGWPEVAAFNDNVMKVGLAGGTLSYKEFELVLHRNGRPEQVWMNLDYSPVPGPGGSPGGVLCVLTEATERVLSERARLESEERLRLATEGARVGLWDWDLIALRGWWSPRTAEIMGVPADTEVTPDKRLALVHPDDRDRLQQQLEAALAGGDEFVHEYRILRPDGEVRHIASRGRIVRDAAGRALRTTGMVIDVSEDRIAAARLRDSEGRLRRAQEAGAIGSYEWSMTGGVGQQSDSMLRLIGLEPGRGYTLKEVLATVMPEDREPVARTVAAIAEGADRAETDYRVRRPDGSIRWLRDIGQLERDADGAPLRWVGIVQDVTARKLAENRLRDSEARLRAVFDAVPLGILIAEAPGGRVLEANPQMDAILGHKVTLLPDAAAYAAWQAWHEDGRPVDPADFPLSRALAGEPRPELDVQHARPDGSRGWLRLVAAPVRDGAGAITAAVVATLDIDRQRRAQDALERLNAHLESEIAARTADRDRMWRLTTDLMLVARMDGIVTAANPAWSRLFGWDEEALVGHSFLDFVHPDDVDATLAQIGHLADGETVFRFENRYRATDGSYRWLSWIAVPDEDLIHAVGRDVSVEKAAAAELAEAQDALRQSQKLEAMGQLTGGVAHDFNNLLSPIIGGLDLLQRRGIGDARTKRTLGGALAAAERAQTLVQRLLAFARRQPLQPTAVDIGALVDGMAGLLASTLGPRIRLQVERPDDLPPALADVNQVEMALLNLVVNARDAMPEGGTLHVAVAAEACAAGADGLPAGRYVRLTVRDTGIGMTPEVLAKAVEPFFSTKGVSRGTGLGLSMVHGLAAQLGGALRLESAPGAGTGVHLWLPVAAPDQAVDPAPGGDALPPRQAGIALVVDDEDLVRMSTSEMLEELGYAVIGASSADEALRIFEAHDGIDVLVTDHLMNGMTGTELAKIVRARRPEMRVLIVSGFAETESIAADLPRLTKPHRLSDLAAALAALS